ncbi:hypothetical protein [Bacillus pseudomycoides]|nr:hypothetical protein [Bacillus pseudomycoides]
MKDKLRDFIIELMQSNSKVIAKDYVVDRLIEVTKEEVEKEKENED